MDPKLVDDIHRGTSYDLGQQPLLPGSPTGRPKGKQRRKPRLPLGCFWPLWSECVPLEKKTHGTPDWGALGVNVMAGLIMGVRESLGGIVSASLLFSSDNLEISSMLQFGISMTLYTMTVGVLWYSVFGRLQYGYGTQQDLICILQASLASKAARLLRDDPERIPATVVCIICFSSILSGFVSIVVGKLAWATSMLMIPKPVVSGFLGAIGVVVLQAAFKTASGVPFHYFWPDIGIRAFCSSQDRLLQVGCMLLHFICIRKGPDLCHVLLQTDKSGAKFASRKDAVKKYAGLVCQLAPLVLFYGCVFGAGVGMEDLAAHGWTYPKEGSSGPLTIWTTYSLEDVDFHVVRMILFSVDIVALVAMAILCTMLGALAITGRYPTGPSGDPQPDDPLDFNAELITVGAASLFLGCTGGNLVFHKFSVIQLREDGGTHRVAVLTIALVAGNLFIFGCPIGSYVPKWFLGGLFMNTGWSFLKKTLLSYETLTTFNWRGVHLVSPQYGISSCCVLMALYFSPTTSILAGLCLSILLFVLDGMTTSPVNSVVDGQHVVSRTKRPWWEMSVLAAEGDRIRLLYLQGQLFFGSMLQLTSNLEAAAADSRIEFVILSYGRVPLIDPSAAENIKLAQDKMAKFGCHVIHCRMNEQVFGTLSAAGAVRKPSADLLMRIQTLGWRYHGSVVCNSDEHPDAFFHETDCLDYCNEYLVQNFSYNVASPTPPLEEYMREYREVICNEHRRLSESAFERMNDLPGGVMGQLRQFCEVRVDEPAGKNLSDELPSMTRAMCFIFKGALSLVQIVPVVEKPDKLETHAFSFRRGKRLLSRYPPGHVAGIEIFFKFHQQRVEENLQPKLIVSSLLGPPAEVWTLRYDGWQDIPGWKQMPDSLKGYLARMLCVQFADTLKHANLKER
ncbi:unnamed protein product [Durusdinium trenchii]|uniref:Uncharacterized protein C24H6.11c n=2 Tax=Durusdinium trenchii TaxID=1381693 RepID=A0ABP0N5V5_9DINO